MSRFQFNRPLLLSLCNRLKPKFRRATNWSHPIPTHFQVLSIVGFLATGDWSGVSQPSMSHILPDVLNKLMIMMREYIQFPYSAQKQVALKWGFFDFADLPNAISDVDCMHQAASTDSFAYMNRNGYHSINVQRISDADCQLLKLVVRWPGGTHVCVVLQNGLVGNQLAHDGVEDSWLIGNWLPVYNTCDVFHRGLGLMIPLVHPQSPQEVLYNQVHSPCTNRMLNGRWRCLVTAGSTLLCAPQKACQIKMACCVLRNITLKHGVPITERPKGLHDRLPI